MDVSALSLEHNSADVLEQLSEVLQRVKADKRRSGNLRDL